MTTASASDYPLKSIAHHEAGHAVATIVQGLAITFVTIEPSEEFLGRCEGPAIVRYEYHNGREKRSIARAGIVAIYAGFEAEKLFNPQADEKRSQADHYNAFRLSVDQVVLPRYCSTVGDEAHWLFLDRLRAEARRLMKRNWHSVSQVAEALLENGTLAHDRVAEIVTAGS